MLDEEGGLTFTGGVGELYKKSCTMTIFLSNLKGQKEKFFKMNLGYQRAIQPCSISKKLQTSNCNYK